MNRQTMIHLSIDDPVQISDALNNLADKFFSSGQAEGPIMNDKGEQVGLVKTLYIGERNVSENKS